MVHQTPDETQAERLGKELGLCRQRGLDNIDVQMHNQSPVEAPELELLVREYGEAKALSAFGRAAQIRVLIQDGSTAYGERGNAAERDLIARLFFDAEHSDKRKRPGVLLAEARAASGLDESRFRDYRHGVFTRFAAFLITFVAEITKATAGELAASASATPTPKVKARPSRLLWLSAGVLGLLVVAAVSVLLLTKKPAARHPVVASSPLVHTPSPTPATRSYAPGKTYVEQTGQYGAPTFTDPHNPSVSGIMIEPYQKVRVSCKVLAPTIPSLSPDGYWYRIASSPWHDRYFAGANTFENGDKIGGPTFHNTDFKVPDCPM